MKNFEKYKSAEEAHKAWGRFCDKQGASCNGCPCDPSKKKTFEMCTIAWMYLEAEKELLPCPFCGGEAKLYSGDQGSWVECTVCNNETGMRDCDITAIENWNRRTDK